jgi:hypothetical protein
MNTPIDVNALFSTPPAAEQKAKRGKPEAAIQRAVTKFLETRGILVERRSVGFDTTRGFSFGTPGEPDLRLSYRGRTAGVEVKAPKSGRVSDVQAKWHARHGADVPTWVVSSIAGAEVVAKALTGLNWPVPGADLRGLK